jgi:endoglucanase
MMILKAASVRTVLSILCFPLILFAGPTAIRKNIRIDQFGYRPGDKKIAVIVDPKIGFNENDPFSPGTIYEVRRWNDDEVVFTDTPEVWHGGAIDFTSGDRGWWFDFSPVSEEGEYYIYDQTRRVGSYRFRIARDVYKDVLKAAARVFYYQRINDPKKPPYAEEPWTDNAAFIGPGQDTEARYIGDKENKSLARDLSGGWMDAGDYNKYVTFADKAVHVLLTAFEENPAAFTDDYAIPESGNGIPDIIDEVKCELDWIKKMQVEDGGVLIKVGNIDYKTASPPSTDRRPRFYGPECSSSSIAAAGMFAHAALVFSRYPSLTGYAEDLGKRAVKAWEWYQRNPRSENCDNGEIKSGDADCSLEMQDEMEVVSAIYLFALTGKQEYHEVVRQNFFITSPFYNPHFFLYNSQQGDALLYYANLANADIKAREMILSQRIKQGRGYDIFQYRQADDLYMAYLPAALYNWGSNHPRAAIGSANYDFIFYNLDGANAAKYKDRALGILHYFHGVNPFGIVYLSTMYRCGAEYCADSIWHDWFRRGTRWDGNPPPGYVPGGPNRNYNGTVKALALQPLQKCFRNWNGGYPENSWEITEPAIYYQAAYVKLLSKFFIPAAGPKK